MENIEYSSASEAVEASVIFMEKLVGHSRFYVKVGSQKYDEMRYYLPYAIHETPVEGTRILVNRNYKPQGSNLPLFPEVSYEDHTNLHLKLDADELLALVGSNRIFSGNAYLYKDGDSPWIGKKCARDYLERLKKLASILA